LFENIALEGKKSMAEITLNRIRLRREFIRHPWVYKNSVEEIDGDAAEDGDLVELKRPDGRFLAWGFINSKSKLYVRMISFDQNHNDPKALFIDRVKAAVSLRRDILKLDERATAYRVIHSEADGIPGVIADRYGDYVVISCTCLGSYKLLDTIVETLVEELQLKGVFEVGSAKGIRGIEGLPPGRGILHGDEVPMQQVIVIDGLKQHVQISGGQKTGAFLDQRDNVRRFAKLCKGATVLDACCYGGSFGLMAAKAGATKVEAFDVSTKAVELATKNAELNEIDPELWSVRRGDLFTELKRLKESGQKFGRIVLDPPNFAGSKRDIPKARKAYVAAHSLALKILEPGGLLLTCTCSHHISPKIFEDTLQEAARRSHTSLQVIERLGAGRDHPQEIFCPEGRYLSGLLVRSIR
jgi:23S rRNA (cytosine1962-C5)-methyltransferase